MKKFWFVTLAVLLVGGLALAQEQSQVPQQQEPQQQTTLENSQETQQPQTTKEDSHEAQRLQKAAEVVTEEMTAPDKGIPRDLLNKAVCVGVIPSEKKLAFVAGGTFGRGALVCRRGGNGPWGAPSMFTVTGANFGYQVGAQSTDFVLLVMNPSGAQKLVQSKLKLGADASVAAGPVGRNAEGSTDLQLHSEILTYSHTRGLFAGASLSGQVITQDNHGNERLYGRQLDPKDILFTDKVPTPPAAEPLDQALMKVSPEGGQKMMG